MSPAFTTRRHFYFPNNHMKTLCDIRSQYDSVEQGTTRDWEKVTCGSCLKLRPKWEKQWAKN